MIQSQSYTYTGYQNVVFQDISKTETGYNRTAFSAMHQHGTDVDIAIRDSCDVTEDPYAESTDDIYDHTYNRRHHSNINDDLYSHATDDIYDTTNQNCPFQEYPTYENISKIDIQQAMILLVNIDIQQTTILSVNIHHYFYF